MADTKSRFIRESPHWVATILDALAADGSEGRRLGTGTPNEGHKGRLQNLLKLHFAKLNRFAPDVFGLAMRIVTFTRDPVSLMCLLGGLTGHDYR